MARRGLGSPDLSISMIEHTESEIGVLEEDEFIAIGLGGMVSGERADVLLSFGKNPDQQDLELGFDRLYFDYNQLGGYGLVKHIALIKDKTIKVILLERAKKCGVPDTELAFDLAKKIDPTSLDMLKSICSKSGTGLQIE
jgi:hypothetical protein